MSTTIDIANSASTVGAPEDYAKNVAAVWSSPELFSAVEYLADFCVGAGVGAPKRSNPTVDPLVEIVWKRQMNAVFRKKISAQLDLYGNCFIRARRGETSMKLEFLQTERVKIYLDSATTHISAYVYLPPRIGSGPDPAPIILKPEEVLHFKESSSESPYLYGFSALHKCAAGANPDDMLKQFHLRRVETRFERIEPEFTDVMNERRRYIVGMLTPILLEYTQGD